MAVTLIRVVTAVGVSPAHSDTGGGGMPPALKGGARELKAVRHQHPCRHQCCGRSMRRKAVSIVRGRRRWIANVTARTIVMMMTLITLMMTQIVIGQGMECIAGLLGLALPILLATARVPMAIGAVQEFTLNLYDKLVSPYGYADGQPNSLGEKRLGIAISLGDGGLDAATVPGPTLTVTQGDDVVVTVYNRMAVTSQGVTVHWHGILQKGTPWNDGVKGVTMCDTPAGDSYVYRFVADVAGTYMYHGHTGTEDAKGLIGAFIVRDQDDGSGVGSGSGGGDGSGGNGSGGGGLQDGQGVPADEFVMVVHEWLPEDPDILIAAMTEGQMGMLKSADKPPATVGLARGVGPPTDQSASSSSAPSAAPIMPAPAMLSDMPFGAILVNGKTAYVLPKPSDIAPSNTGDGRTNNTTMSSSNNSTTVDSGSDNNTAIRGSWVQGALPEIFRVIRGQSYRFRFINGMVNYAVRLRIESHVMTVTSVDGGQKVQPVTYQQIFSQVGERYDFTVVVDQPAGAYWIYLEAQEDIDEHADVFMISHAVLLVSEDGQPGLQGDGRRDSAGACLPGDETCWQPPGPPIPPESISVFNTSASLSTVVDVNQLVPLRSSALPTPARQVNVVVESGAMSDDCNEDCYWWTLNGIRGRLPRVPTYVSGGDFGMMTDSLLMVEVKVGEVVDVLIDNSQTNMGHPFHLHGHHFWVLGVGAGGSAGYNNQSLPSAGQAVQPIKRDMVTVPPLGWAMIRVQFDNSGPWIFHCHVVSHLMTGMMMLFTVGDKTAWPVPSPPPGGGQFDLCGATSEDWRKIYADEWARQFVSFDFSGNSEQSVNGADDQHEGRGGSDDSGSLSQGNVLMLLVGVSTAVVVAFTLVSVRFIEKRRFAMQEEKETARLRKGRVKLRQLEEREEQLTCSGSSELIV